MFDTCGTGYFEAKKGFEPDLAELNETLVKNRVKGGIKLTKLDLVDVPVAEVVYEVAIAGMG